MYSHLAMEEGEDIITADVFLAQLGQPSKPGDSVRPKWAFNEQNVERPKWIEAKDLEQTRLLAYNTWRRLEAAEEADWRAGKIKAVTTALILNRKRYGRYKARLVVLGNQWKPDGENNVFASVVSQTGNRSTLLKCVREAFEVVHFDISNAFIHASMGDIKVVVNIPDNMKDDPSDTGRRMLLKALYRLPISPRL